MIPNQWIEFIIILVIVLNFGLLGSSRLHTYIKIVAAQGVLLAPLPVLGGMENLAFREIALMLVTIGTKGIAFPWLLGRTLANVNVKREVNPYIGYPLSMVAGVGGLLAALWISDRLVPNVPSPAGLSLSVALMTVFVGLFIIISRRKAVSQAAGFLVFENGIWMLGVVLVPHVSLLLELAVLLDVLVAVFVLGIAIHRIQKEFAHIDMDRLDALKG
jgi:hydrogenase-4 component E